MKRLMVFAVVAVVTLAAAAAMASNYTNSFAAGTYKGKINSVVPEINGLDTTLELKQVGNQVIGTVTYKGGKEIWIWDDAVLKQQEIDLKTGNAVLTYDAKAKGAASGNTQSYSIKCSAPDTCDAGVDSRNYWTLKGDGSKVVYTVYGVDPSKKADKSLKPSQRHEFVFNIAK